ncbi:MAG TPA: alpha/beta hydrolase, partial [Usitatibacteraceae bacterium]|nr:alpha/beta hydrolase [Usitatibacteraceae bacterium]
IRVNGLTLHYESRGDPAAPPILLIMGLGVQMILWPEALIDGLVARGFRVVRFDNRDVGFSTHLDELGMPNIPLAYVKFLMRLPLNAPYLIEHMAEDTAHLIDALGLGRPHVVGASMGGMIGQNLAAQFPGKVATLTSIMSTTGRRSLPKPQWRALRAILSPPGNDVESATQRMMAVLTTIGSRTHPTDRAVLREFCERHVRRSYNPAGGARQLMAIAASDDRSELVRTIRAPTLVLHGDEDPLVPLEAGRDTAQRINEGGGSATLKVIRGMGHDFPAPLIPGIVEDIALFCRAHPPPPTEAATPGDKIGP